jgi:hypothetical protein
MSYNYPDSLRIVQARVLYATFNLTMVEIGASLQIYMWMLRSNTHNAINYLGIHIFMALYGLSVFLETPEAQRRGRKRYIAVSFAITVLRAISGSFDTESYFQVLFKSTSPQHWWQSMVAESIGTWKRFVINTTGVGMVMMIGDALLVRAVP